MKTAARNPEARPDRLFVHKNGKTYVCSTDDGCLHQMPENTPIWGLIYAFSLRDGKRFGPARVMKLDNVARWL